MIDLIFAISFAVGAGVLFHAEPPISLSPREQSELYALMAVYFLIRFVGERAEKWLEKR